MNRPPDELLESAAPLSVWRAAELQAKRSPHKRFATGCAIYDGVRKNPKIFSRGCAHPHNGGMHVRSIHAEMDAVRKLPPGYGGAIAVLVTLTRSDGFASISKPCQICAELLVKFVWIVVYAERANDGSWMVISNNPGLLIGCKPTKTKENSNGWS